MSFLKPTRGIQLDKSHPLVRGLVLFWVFNEGSGKRVFDLSGHGHTGTLVGMPWISCKYGSAVQLAHDGDEIDISDNRLDIPAGSDFTYIWSGFIELLNPTNSGFWRSGNTSTGDTFVVFQGTVSGLPWIRLGGIDVLKPESGTGVPFNEFVNLAYVVKSGVWAGWYVNGVLEHEDSHVEVAPSFFIVRFGWQALGAEAVIGCRSHQSFYDRALLASEIAQLNVDPFCIMRCEAPGLPLYSEAIEVVIAPTRRRHTGFSPIVGADRLRGIRQHDFY